jgi:SAM-dependent methyltransferase
VGALYDDIGVGYAHVRRPEPRLAAQIHAALGDAVLVLDVGAGTGSYEPHDRRVVAVEPSPAMIAQRATDAAPVTRAVGEALPFRPAAFDAAMATLTIHHWPDPVRGLQEVRRVTRGPIVVLTFDLAVHEAQWLVAEYLPEMRLLDQHLPSPDALVDALGGGRVEVVPVPFDCVDGFCHAWWRRPEAYLDPRVRAGISGIARQPDAVVARAVAQLEADLADGTWHTRHADLLQREEIDAGYRLVVLDP